MVVSRALRLVVLLATVTAFAGCTSVGWDIVYAPPTPETNVAIASAPMKTVTVYDLADERPDKLNVGGEYNKLGTMVERYQSTKTASQLVTEAIISNLEAQGVKVIRSSGWDGTPRALSDVVTDLALGGKLKVFWVERQPAGVYLDYLGWSGANASSQVVASITIMAPDGMVLWQGDISGSDVFRTSFGAGDPKKMLEKALKDAVDSLANNQQIRQLWYASATPSKIAVRLLAIRF